MSNLNSRNFVVGSFVSYGPNLCIIVSVEGSSVRIAPLPHQSLAHEVTVHESEVDMAELIS